MTMTFYCQFPADTTGFDDNGQLQRYWYTVCIRVARARFNYNRITKRSITQLNYYSNCSVL